MAVSVASSPAIDRLSVPRVQSIDVVRGVVMVLMAIDHVRVYAGVPAGGPTPGLFFTRWVTHFCAPAFAFLAGTSAFLYGRRLGDWRRLSSYLVTRGLMLVALELTVIHVAWTFTFDFTQLLAGVIWMLGWCMVLMAPLVRFSPGAVGTFGVLVIAFQQLCRFVPDTLFAAAGDSWNWVWQVLYLGGTIAIPANGVNLSILYNIVPWIGVMAAGYGFGSILLRDATDRRRLCLRIGGVACVLFLAVGGLQAALTPAEDNTPLLFRLLNQNKYRDSQLFLLMTLGPTIALMPLAERARGWLGAALATFGRVPLFYYLLHIPVIHAAALVVWRFRVGRVDPEWFATAPYVAIADQPPWPLWLLYLVFVIVVALLYPCCRWYASVKAARPQSWLRYL